MVTDQTPDDGLLLPGVRGHVRGDLKLLRHAIRKGWNLKDSYWNDLPERAYKLAMHSPDDRTSLGAIKALIAMDMANVNAVKAEKEPAGVTVNVGVNVDNRPIATVDERNSRLAAICRAASDRRGTGRSIEATGTPTDTVLPAQPNGETNGVSGP